VNSAPIVLVPGHWLGAWAWDEVAALLRADGHQVTALTLPGLESPDADRSGISMSDHVDAIGQAVVAAGPPVVLAVHSGAGVPGYGVSDQMPERIAAMVYVDSAPATGAIDPSRSGVEVPLPSWEELDESLEGLTEAQLDTFRRRAVAEPGAAYREAPALTNEARTEVPSVMICTSFTGEQYRAAVKEGYPWLGGLAELRNVTYVELPTSHWPMWSRSKDLAELIGRVAKEHGSD